MTCAEFDILLCGSIDGTLTAPEREAFEAHQRTCGECAELARDASGAAAFIGRVEHPGPPPELMAKIAFEISSAGVSGQSFRSAITGWFQPLLQPRFAMGMAMTILSFSMLARFAGVEVRQLRASDLHPAAVWSAVDNRMHRTWDQALKYYENLRLVYEVQARLQEWTEQEDEEKKGRSAAEDGAALPGGKPGSNQPGVNEAGQNQPRQNRPEPRKVSK